MPHRSHRRTIRWRQTRREFQGASSGAANQAWPNVRHWTNTAVRPACLTAAPSIVATISYPQRLADH
jgi:hypothetical protein